MTPPPHKVVQIGTADRHGGAAAVSRALHEGLVARGVDARMLVGVKRSGRRSRARHLRHGRRPPAAPVDRSRRAAPAAPPPRAMARQRHRRSAAAGVARGAGDRGCRPRPRAQPARLLLQPEGPARARFAPPFRLDASRHVADDEPLDPRLRLSALARERLRLHPAQHAAGSALEQRAPAVAPQARCGATQPGSSGRAVGVDAAPGRGAACCATIRCA